MKAKTVDFSRGLDPRKPLQDPKQNFITLRPRMKKRVILRNRDLNAGVDLVKTIEALRTH